MIIIHKLETDLQQNREPELLRAVQGDANTRVLELRLTSGEEAWTVPEDVQVWMRYCKSDGTKGVYDTLPDGSTAWSLKDNVLSIALAPQMLTVPGPVLAQVELIRGVSTLATFAFRISVERNVAAGTVTSEDYVNMLQWMKGELDRLLEEARDSGDFDGPQGPQGEAGVSVMDLAREAGFQGTEEELGRQLVTPCLPLEGGIMAGPVDMGGQSLANLAAPVNSGDAATKLYVDNRRQAVKIQLHAGAWSGTSPYVQTAGVNTVGTGDLVLLRPEYDGELETDLAKKAAFDCISYVQAGNRQIAAVCLEQKPQRDLYVWVHSLH